mmetsp:Transcript_75370/g.151548  ORF Transcript_75370/g.151548 Transcript_75370/m.151548 type:complete len:119 (-) Transcript_75370:752-1108(-)
MQLLVNEVGVELKHNKAKRPVKSGMNSPRSKKTEAVAFTAEKQESSEHHEPPKPASSKKPRYETQHDNHVVARVVAVNEHLGGLLMGKAAKRAAAAHYRSRSIQPPGSPLGPSEAVFE